MSKRLFIILLLCRRVFLAPNSRFPLYLFIEARSKKKSKKPDRFLLLSCFLQRSGLASIKRMPLQSGAQSPSNNYHPNNNKIFIILFLFAFFPAVIIAQINLVPNPSFNLYITCPDTTMPHDQEFRNYYNWFPRLDASPNGLAELGSPDPFHSCNNNYFDYLNCKCYPNDYDGGGGVGMGIRNTTFLYREFSAVKLLQTLQPYQSYCCSFYIANINITTGADVYIINGQMIGFGPSLFIWGNSEEDDYRSYLKVAVQNETIFNDTLVWHKIEGNYIADGTEQYLFLGWAEPLANITWQLVHDTSANDYVINYTLFDSVSVVECNEMGMNIDNIEVPNVITPNGDGLNEDWILNEGNPMPPDVHIQIYNKWGEIVYENEHYQNEWNGKNQCGKELSDGVYYYVIMLPPNQKKAGFVYILR